VAASARALHASLIVGHDDHDGRHDDHEGLATKVTKHTKVKKEKKGFMNRKSVGVGISLGLCFGGALGTATHNVGVGIALGAGLGVAFAMIFGASDAALARTKVVFDKPLPHPLGLFERDEPN